jgi:hypothetical protein
MARPEFLGGSNLAFGKREKEPFEPWLYARLIGGLDLDERDLGKMSAQLATV